VARNGAGGAGRSSNRVSGPKSARIFLSFFFMFFPFIWFSFNKQKTRD
jgi:hypothetical protein